MKKLVIKITILVISVFYLIPLAAQNISIPFSCGFEDSTEVSQWVFNSGPDASSCLDQWMWGNLECNEGYKSLYISCDSGITSTYGAKSNLMIAYRPFVIPSSLDPSKRTYPVDVSFDWKCLGEANVSQLGFTILPEAYLRGDISVLNSSLSPALPRVLSNATLLSGSMEWKSFSMSRSTNIPVDTKFYLVFFWQNSNSDTAHFQPYAACIDNIQITSSNCWKPSSIKVESTCDTMLVTWEGVNESYDFEYRPSGANTWRSYSGLQEKSFLVTNVGEGAYDVRVRGVCGDEKSAWVTQNSVVCFCPDNHCINYVNLDHPDVVCEIGKASDPTRGRAAISSTMLGNSGNGPIDYGSNSSRSRHTVNWKQNEYDPRTGNLLRTIPPGEFASVRIGNWEAGGEAEGITFSYSVDTTEAFIILVKYAIVLEDPGHGKKADPYFKVEIVDENGNMIDTQCGEFEFTPEDGNVKWHICGDFVWKDWTSIGLNLAQYHGQTIKIRFLTQDCTYSAHCGYAYFTLDCADAAIKSTSCGETVNMEMEAPDGFSYIWTKADNPDEVISTDKKISVPANDTTTYYCRVDYIDVTGCGFLLHTSVFPRFPFADVSYEIKPENCQNNVYLKNLSCVHTKVDKVDKPTSEPCETFYWSINDGEVETQIEDVVYTMPNDGGELKVTLVASISDNQCQDDTTIVISVPPIYEHHDTLYETLCDGNIRIFDDRMLGLPGVYTEYKKNIWGCDSITVLNLSFVPQPEDVHIYDTICSTDVYKFNGKVISEAGEHRFMLPGAYGCDSIVFVHLEKIDPMGVAVDDTRQVACADDEKISVDYILDKELRKPAYYSIEFDSLARKYGFENVKQVAVEADATIDIALPENCRPNSYTAKVTFVDTTGVCGDISAPLAFDVYYSSSIMQPKFDNLIAVLDETQNGGYEFVEESYRWYKNDQLVDSMKAFYYLPEGEVFGEDDCFYMVVERVDDGVVMRTCEVCPTPGTAIEDVYDPDWQLQATLLDKGQPIVIENITKGQARLYTITGQLISATEIVDSHSVISVPAYSGTYILFVTAAEYCVSYKVQVK